MTAQPRGAAGNLTGTIGRVTRARSGDEHSTVIRNAVIHITNEQPLLADLYDVPKPADVTLVCTNVRMLDGKKPIFVDHTDSIFIFPYLNVRFVELVPGSVADKPALESGNGTAASILAGAPPEPEPEPEPELELDEDFLRRIREV